MKSMVKPNSSRDFRRRDSTWACTDASSPETGSSATMKSGEVTSARGDSDALALTTGEFVRVAMQSRVRESDEAQHLADAFLTLAC